MQKRGIVLAVVLELLSMPASTLGANPMPTPHEQPRDTHSFVVEPTAPDSISDDKNKSSGFTVRDEIAVPEIYGEGAKLYRVSVSPSTTPLLRLVIDRNGVASVGRLFPQKKCETLVGVSKSEMRSVFGTPFSSTKTTDRFNVSGWCEKWSGKSYGKKWDNFRLEIQYRDDCCYQYAITGPGIAKKKWERD